MRVSVKEVFIAGLARAVFGAGKGEASIENSEPQRSRTESFLLRQFRAVGASFFIFLFKANLGEAGNQVRGPAIDIAFF